MLKRKNYLMLYVVFFMLKKLDISITNTRFLVDSLFSLSRVWLFTIRPRKFILNQFTTRFEPDKNVIDPEPDTNLTKIIFTDPILHI